MLKAVIYCRCSTEEESQQEALKKQVMEAKESVDANGWQLVDAYIEAKSGTTANKRKEYLRLLEDLQTNKFDVVQIKSQDRLMRNTKDWYLFVDRLVSNNKRLYMYMERTFYTPDDALITGIKAILAEEYSKELSKKINNAHRNRQKAGAVFMLPKGTYGYEKLPDKSIAIVEEEAKVIRKMFYLAQTMGCRRIASVLEREGHRDRSGQIFQEETIRRIIRNPLRYGTVVQNKRHYDFSLKQEQKMPEEEWIIHKHAIPSIVSEDIWQAANQAMNERADQYHTTMHHAGVRSAKFDLSGKIICGLCGGKFYRRHRKRTKKHTVVMEWKCKNYLCYGRSEEKKTRARIQKTIGIKERGCDNIHLEEGKLLELLEAAFASDDQRYGVQDSEIIAETLNVLQQVFIRKEAVDTEKKLNQLIRKQEALSERLVDKLLDGVLADEDYKRKKAVLDEKLYQLRKEAAMHQETENLDVEVEDRLYKIKERLSADILRKAVRSVLLEQIESIQVFEDRLQIQVDQECNGAAIPEIFLDQEIEYGSRKEAERVRIIAYMKENPCITAREIANIEQISLTTINYRIKKLRQQSRIYFDGRGGHGKWVVSEGEEEK